MSKVVTRREYICTRCGHRTTQSANSGRPNPGVCIRSKNNAPHRWVKNRDFYCEK